MRPEAMAVCTDVGLSARAKPGASVLDFWGVRVKQSSTAECASATWFANGATFHGTHVLLTTHSHYHPARADGVNVHSYCCSQAPTCRRLQREDRKLTAPPHLILLVDDDDDVRETSADMLQELGYRVVQASNGLEALRALAQHPELELMVTDVRMPGMSGLELSELAVERHRGLKVILVSGYFIPQPIRRRFLQKPFRTNELDAAIRAELYADTSV